MRNIKYLLIVACMLFLFGCTNKQLNKNATYYDRNNMYNRASLNEVTLQEDGVITVSSCGIDAGCTLGRGTYEIKDDKLIATINMYQDVTGEWLELESKYVSTYEYLITNENEFSFEPKEGYKQFFVLKK